MARHAEPERFPTNDRAEQRMRDDAARQPTEDQRGRHDAPPAEDNAQPSK